MPKVNLKKDFTDGTVLYGQDLNAITAPVEAAINMNKDDLDEKIESTNIIAGENVVITRDGLDLTISAVAGGEAILDHNSLYNRDAINQHPIGSITGLQTTIDATNTLMNETRVLTAIATTNGDYKINIQNTLVTNMILNISFPTATVSTANTRLSIDDGLNYKNIKLTRGFNNIPASLIGNQYATLKYNGTRWEWIDTKLVAYYSFISAGNSTGDIPVNLTSDGWNYEALITSKGTTGFANDPGNIYLWYNGDTTANNYSQIRSWVYDTNIVVSENANSPVAGFIYKSGSFNLLNISVSEGKPICISKNTLITSANKIQSLSYNQHFKNAVSNVTSLRFTTDNNVGIGTEIRIYKK